MSIANAWLIDLGDGRHAAIGERELFHLVFEPELFPVPQCPAYCARVIAWEGRLLPVWDVGRWLQPAVDTAAPWLVAVVGYQREGAQETEFGALGIAAPPQRIVARDEDVCALPDDSLAWESISTSCFAHDHKRVPALNLTSMFGRALSTGV